MALSWNEIKDQPVYEREGEKGENEGSGSIRKFSLLKKQKQKDE